jgi:hypothetical protein
MQAKKIYLPTPNILVGKGQTNIPLFNNISVIPALVTIVITY